MKQSTKDELTGWILIALCFVPVFYFAIKAREKVRADNRVAAALERLADWAEAHPK